MSDHFEQFGEDGDQYIARIYPDCNAGDPRDPDTQDNAWTFVSLERFREYRGFGDAGMQFEDYDSMADYIQTFIRVPGALVVPIYYQYGEDRLRITDTQDRDPDGDAVGFAYVTAEKFTEEWGENRRRRWKGKTARQWALSCLAGEIAQYNDWAEGRVYGWRLLKMCGECGSYKHVDSCWGYYGYDYVKEEAQASLDSAREDKKAA